MFELLQQASLRRLFMTHVSMSGEHEYGPPRMPFWRSLALGALALLWIGLSGLLIACRGDPESFLQRTFVGHSRSDAFHNLNRTVFLFWVVHSCLVLTALTATWFRNPDILVVLLIGPAIGLIIGSLIQDWSDPNWVVFVGVCLMGWLASTLVGLVYWGVKSNRKSDSLGATLGEGPKR